MVNRKILLMILFSFSAHLAVAAVIVYIPNNMSGSSVAGHKDRVIWGYVEGSNKSLIRGKLNRAINIDQQNNKTPKGRSKPNGYLIAANPDETSMTPRRSKDDKNNPSIPPIEKGGTGGFDGLFSSETSRNEEFKKEDLINTLPFKGRDRVGMGVSSKSENGLAKGESVEAETPSIPSGEYDDIEGSICHLSEDCGTVSITTGSTGSKSYDINALVEYVRKELERHKYYPDTAKLNGIEGTVYINFYIGQDGIPSSISVVRSSGSKILDAAGVKAVLMIDRISNINEELREIDFAVPITYKLTE